MQSLSTWTHAQLTAFGTRLWTGKERSPETVIKNDTITRNMRTHVVMSNIYKEDESFSSKFNKLDAIQKQISEADTMSEISHSLVHDDDKELVMDQLPEKGSMSQKEPIGNGQIYRKDDNETTVKAIIHAQDIIAKTQREHFDNLLTCLGKSNV